MNKYTGLLLFREAHWLEVGLEIGGVEVEVFMMDEECMHWCFITEVNCCSCNDSILRCSICQKFISRMIKSG